MNGRISSTGGLSEYDEYVPMVDKAVDVGWAKQASHQNTSVSGGEILQVHFAAIS